MDEPKCSKCVFKRIIDFWVGILDRLKKINIKRLFLIFLTYLIPFINISMVLPNHHDLKASMIEICSVLASTAAASACTIKGIKSDDDNILNIMQAFALVFSVVSFICCLVFNISNVLYINVYEIVVLTFLANAITIAMFIRSDKDLNGVMNEYRRLQKEAENLVKDADEYSKGNKSKMNLTKKGGNK